MGHWPNPSGFSYVPKSNHKTQENPFLACPYTEIISSGPPGCHSAYTNPSGDKQRNDLFL